MNKEPTADDAAEDVLTDEIEAEQSDEVETVEADEVDDGNQEPEVADEQEPDKGGLVVSLGEEEDEDDQSQPFRDMRQELREAKRKLKEFENAQPEPSQEIGEEPQLADFDFDADKYKDAYTDWYLKKQDSDAKAKAKKEADEKLASEFQEKQSSYRAAAKKLPVKDFEAVEDVVKETLPEVVQSIIVDCAKQPELMVYALGKNPDVMEGLPKGGTFRDAVSAAFELGRMEAGLKVTGMKNKPKPEGRVEGGGKLPKTGDQQLEQLEAEAEKTGDRTQVVAHKKRMRENRK